MAYISTGHGGHLQARASYERTARASLLESVGHASASVGGFALGLQAASRVLGPLARRGRLGVVGTAVGLGVAAIGGAAAGHMTMSSIMQTVRGHYSRSASGQTSYVRMHQRRMT